MTLLTRPWETILYTVIYHIYTTPILEASGYWWEFFRACCGVDAGAKPCVRPGSRACGFQDRLHVARCPCALSSNGQAANAWENGFHKYPQVVGAALPGLFLNGEPQGQGPPVFLPVQPWAMPVGSSFMASPYWRGMRIPQGVQEPAIFSRNVGG